MKNAIQPIKLVARFYYFCLALNAYRLVLCRVVDINGQGNLVVSHDILDFPCPVVRCKNERTILKYVRHRNNMGNVPVAGSDPAGFVVRKKVSLCAAEFQTAQ